MRTIAGLSGLLALLAGCAGASQEEHPAPPLALAADTVVTRSVRYAGDDGAAQLLDVYAPVDARGLPVLLFVHGGGWTRGSRSDVGSLPKLLNEQGIVLVSLDYRLSPAHVHPAHVQDVAAAVAWTRANIERFGGDGRKLILMGHSAGSHLVALAGTDPRFLAGHGMKPSDLRGVVSLDGSAFDIVERIEKGGEKLAENCRRAFGPDPAVHRDASPLRHVSRGAALPSFLLVYVKEGSLNHSQSKAFVDRVRDAGGKTRLLRIDGKTHFTLASDLGTDRDAAGMEVVRFVREVAAP